MSRTVVSRTVIQSMIEPFLKQSIFVTKGARLCTPHHITRRRPWYQMKFSWSNVANAYNSDRGGTASESQSNIRLQSVVNGVRLIFCSIQKVKDRLKRLSLSGERALRANRIKKRTFISYQPNRIRTATKNFRHTKQILSGHIRGDVHVSNEIQEHLSEANEQTSSENIGGNININVKIQQPTPPATPVHETQTEERKDPPAIREKVFTDAYLPPEANHTEAEMQLEWQLQQECRERNEKAGREQFVVRDLRIVDLDEELHSHSPNEQKRKDNSKLFYAIMKYKAALSFVCWLVFGVIAIFGLATLIVTAINFGDCKGEKLVPIGLLVYAILLLLICLPFLFLSRKAIGAGEDEQLKTYICAILAAILLIVALMMWLILGSIAYANANWTISYTSPDYPDDSLATTPVNNEFDCNSYISVMFKIAYFGTAAFVVIVLFTAFVGWVLWIVNDWGTHNSYNTETHAQR